MRPGQTPGAEFPITWVPIDEPDRAHDKPGDSIDAVDLIVQLKPVAGKRISPEVFKSVRTLQDVVDALHGLLHSDTAAA